MDFYVCYNITDSFGNVLKIDYIAVNVPIDNATNLNVIRADQDYIKAIDAGLAFAHIVKFPYFPHAKKVRDKRVRCNETGEIFNTMAAAIAKNGGNAPSMSNHLSGRPGYPKVNGFTYSIVV